MARASAPGKLILFGEHAVVFGEPALATAIDLRTEVFARLHDEWLVDGASLQDTKYAYVRRAVEASWKGPPLWFEIRSMIPLGCGLGSSAAVTVATLGALAALQGPVDTESVARAAFEVEHAVQGRASPIDTSTAAHGAAVLVRREPGDGLLWTIEEGGRRWSLHHSALPATRLVVGNTGIAAATGPLVAGVKARVDRDPEAAAAIAEIGEITLDGLRAFQRGDLVRAGELMDRDHELLNLLGVGHPLLDKFVEAARPHAYGAKLTGAGGGGSMFALTDEPEEVRAAIEAAGGTAFLVETEPRGLEASP
jgi:mevalonate kinase